MATETGIPHRVGERSPSAHRFALMPWPISRNNCSASFSPIPSSCPPSPSRKVEELLRSEMEHLDQNQSQKEFRFHLKVLKLKHWQDELNCKFSTDASYSSHKCCTKGIRFLTSHAEHINSYSFPLITSHKISALDRLLLSTSMSQLYMLHPIQSLIKRKKKERGKTEETEERLQS